jgi:TonB family protein
MREHSVAISVSLLFHIIIVALFLRVPFDQYIKPKLIALDFLIEKGRTANKAEDVNLKPEIANRKSQIEGRELPQNGQMIEHMNTITEKEGSIEKRLVAEPSGNLSTIASDPAGQVIVRGETGPMGVKADSISGKNISVGEGSGNLPAVSGSMRVIDYGKGGSGARDFAFIADTINKRFLNSYPSRANTERWEGEVLLSFVIFEDGTIRNVKIVKGSGHIVLDSHAREIIMKTTLNRKLPEPLQIDNWRVTYKLQ